MNKLSCISWNIFDMSQVRHPVKYINAFGDIFWKHGTKLHKDNGPAIIYANGDKEWYLNGKVHREDGPAIIYSDGGKFWYWYGVLYSFEDYVKAAGWSDEQIVMYKLEPG